MTRVSGRGGETGFTLIEVVAALTVFAIMTLGIVPVILTSIRAATLARTYTVGKNAALKSMERVRGLPYYISYSAQPRRVDVLDFYFPSTTSTPPNQTYSAGTSSFSTTCQAGSALPSCPKDLPADYTVTYFAQFVEAVEGASGVTYEPRPPQAGYTWNGAAGLDLPPTQLLFLRVTASWTAANKARSYRITTLISDRKFGDVKVEGTAQVSYGVQALTGYVDQGSSSEVVARLGRSESNIEMRTSSSAKQNVTAGELTLTESVSGNATAQELDSFTGANTALDAPPAQNPLGTSSPAGTVVHPTLGAVAGLGPTTVQGPTPGLEVTVENELPEAHGGWQNDPEIAKEDLWVHTQVDDFAAKLLEPTRHVLSVRPRLTGTETGASGASFAQTFGLGTSGRGVQTNATVAINQVELLPTSFISIGSRAVIEISNFTATVDCKATANGATSIASPTWSATLKFFDANFGLGDYRTINLSGNAASDALQPYGTGAGQSNPIVYKDPAGKDVYLFDDPALNRPGYLRAWSSLHNVTTTGFRNSADGKTVSADIGGALRIDVAPTDPARPHTSMQLALGSLSCSAVDRR